MRLEGGAKAGPAPLPGPICFTSSSSLLSIEALDRRGHEDVQGLLDLQLLASAALIKDGSLTPLDGMLGIPGIHGYAQPLPMSQCVCTASLCSLSLVSSLQMVSPM